MENDTCFHGERKMRFEAFTRTDPGPVRENNEDNMLIDIETGLFAVADGMGGHECPACRFR